MDSWSSAVLKHAVDWLGELCTTSAAHKNEPQSSGAVADRRLLRIRTDREFPVSSDAAAVGIGIVDIIDVMACWAVQRDDRKSYPGLR